MALLRLSPRAEADLLGISDHTLQAWGEVQAFRYIDALESFCQWLADNPALGRSCDDVLRGLPRVESDSMLSSTVRMREEFSCLAFLHRRMLPERYDMDDDDHGS